MARPLRLRMPGGIHHVVSRGNARQDVFLTTLRSVTEHMNVLCHVYCLMGNHYHLLLETPDANLSLAIRQLNGVYAQSFNRRHGRVGHLFQGRFHSRLVEKETYLLAVSRYIVLNPVRASLVPHPSKWSWSSYRAHVGWIEPPPFLSMDWLLACFDTVDRRSAQKAYRKFVLEGLKGPQPTLRDLPILGTDAFVAGFRDALASVAPLKAIPRVQRFAARPSLQELFAGDRDRRDRNVRIREAYVSHGYTMTEIANHLELHLMTISRAVHWKLKCET